MEDFVISGVSLMALVFGLVEFAKSMGLTGKACTVLAMVLGIAFAVLFKAVEMYPVISPWVQTGVVGLAFGLATSGFYDFAKAFKRG